MRIVDYAIRVETRNTLAFHARHFPDPPYVDSFALSVYVVTFRDSNSDKRGIDLPDPLRTKQFHNISSLRLCTLVSLNFVKS